MRRVDADGPADAGRVSPAVRTSGALRTVVEAVLVWAGLTAILYIAYELIDHLWLAGLPDDRRATAQLVRGVATSLTATVVTALFVLARRAPPSAWIDRSPAADLAAGDEGRGIVAEWLLGLRWVAVLVVAAVVIASTTSEPHVAPEAILPLWVGVVLLFALNAVLSLAGARRATTVPALLVQSAGDAFVLSLLVHFAGGIANPFSGFFVFHAVISAIVLEPRMARRVGVAMGIYVVLLTVAEASGAVAPPCVRGLDGACRAADPLHLTAAGLAVATTVVGCAYFVAALVDQLRGERERAERARDALAMERQTLQSILECMADAVLFADSSGRIVLRNRAASALWGKVPPPTTDLRVCHTSETWQRLLAKIADPAPVELHPVLVVDGRSHEATYARVCDPDGTLRGVVMVARDVTERQKAQEWRMKEERMAVVGTLAAALAHELNNPLGAIALFTRNALKRLPSGDPLTDHLATVLRNADQCSRIVRDLLTYARQRAPERRDFDAVELVGDVERTVQPAAERARISLRVDLDSGASRSYGDPDQLRQVLVNLALNAIEAMDDGGELRLRVAAGADGSTTFSVRDTGPGVSPDERERIFSAFYTTKPNGTGLGLAVAQDIVSAHGGRLVLESDVGRGSTFVVSLPARPERNQEAVA